MNSYRVILGLVFSILLFYFVPKHVDPWDFDKSDWSPVMKSAYYNDTLKIISLTKQGSNINAKNKSGWTALKVAVKKGNAKTVSFLLRHSADPNIGDNSGFTPLMEACQHSYTTITKLLLHSGANSNSSLPNGWTAIISAASQGADLQIIKLLAQYKADVNATRGIDGISALKFAESNKDKPMIKLLKSLGAQ